MMVMMPLMLMMYMCTPVTMDPATMVLFTCNSMDIRDTLNVGIVKGKVQNNCLPLCNDTVKLLHFGGVDHLRNCPQPSPGCVRALYLFLYSVPFRNAF